MPAFSPQARREPAGNLKSLHWTRLADGRRPMRCGYCADPDQCPMRSWWISIASWVFHQRAVPAAGQVPMPRDRSALTTPLPGKSSCGLNRFIRALSPGETVGERTHCRCCCRPVDASSRRLLDVGTEASATTRRGFPGGSVLVLARERAASAWRRDEGQARLRVGPPGELGSWLRCYIH